MENDTENANSSNSETTAEAEKTDSTQVEDVSALKAKLQETEEANKQLFERAKKAEGFVKVEGKWVKAAKSEAPAVSTQEPKAKTGELDNNALDYLDLKGISDPDDIKVVEDIVRKTGMTVRQALKDDYVAAKLKANQDKREVQNATPSRTNRGGNQQADIASAVATFEQTGKLPDDFALKSAVINAMVDKSSTNKPAWH